MPFGMVNSTATLARGLRKLLANLGDVINYMDDIIVHSKDWDDHVRSVKELLSRLREANSSLLQDPQSVIASQALDFVGHHI